MTWPCPRCNTENPDDAEECLECKKELTPYYKKNLSDKQSVRDQFTIEVDAEERAWIEQLKVRWDFKSDSKVLKLCLENAIKGQNVSWSEATWRYVLSAKRQRLSNFQKLPEPTPNENAMHN